jgi:hypothetical protein
MPMVLLPDILLSPVIRFILRVICHTFTFYLPISFDDTFAVIGAAPSQGRPCFVSFLEAFTLRIAEFGQSSDNMPSS